MINDDVVDVISPTEYPESLVAAPAGTLPATAMSDITDNDIVRGILDQNSMAAELYAAAGRGLSGNGEKWIAYYEVLKRLIVPPTRKTQVRGPEAETHARRLPAPESLRLVTSMTAPPRPPTETAPPPCAPGKAGTAALANVGANAKRPSTMRGCSIL